MQEDQPRLQVEGARPQRVRRVLPVGAQCQVVVHHLDDPPVAVHDRVRLPTRSRPHDPTHVHPDLPTRWLLGWATVTDNGHDQLSATRLRDFADPSWRTSLTLLAYVQIKAEAYGKFAEEPTRPELERFFFLDDVDRDLSASRRTKAHQLGFAVQMCTVRYVGRFLVDDPLDVPWSVVEHLAAQLGIEDPSCVKRYTERSKTAYEHAWEIRDAYGYHPFEDAEGAGSSGRSCTGGRGRAPRRRWHCSTRRWGGCGATGCCCRVSRCWPSRSPRCARSRRSGCTPRSRVPYGGRTRRCRRTWWRCSGYRRGARSRSWSGCAGRRRARRARAWRRPWSGWMRSPRSTWAE